MSHHYVSLIVLSFLLIAVDARELRGDFQNRSSREERAAAEREEAARRRALFELYERRQFQDNAKKVFDLTRELVAMTNGPLDAETKRRIHKTAEQIEGKVGKMKQYLGGKKARDKNRALPTFPSLADAVLGLTGTLNALRGDLLTVALGQTLTLDVELRTSVLQRLEIVQQTVAAFGQML